MAFRGLIFESIMTTIYWLSSFAFIYFGVQAVKRKDHKAMILCLLFTLSCFMIAFDYFWFLTVGTFINTSQFVLSWSEWTYWIYYLCVPQAFVLITYTLFCKMLSFEKIERDRIHYEKLVRIIAIINAIYNFIFVFYLPAVKAYNPLYPEQSFICQILINFFLWAFAFSEMLKHKQNNRISIENLKSYEINKIQYENHENN